MQTRRDQLQAYRYLIRRVMTALRGSEPEAPEQPMRRVIAGTMSGILVAVIAGGIVGAVGFFTKKGATGWKEGDNLVLEKETGSSYVYLAAEKTLFPVANYTSAVLLVGAEAEPVKASRKDIAESGVRVGPQVGILGAPSSLPDPKAITSTPWTACSTLQDKDDGSTPTSRVSVLIGSSAGKVGAQNLGKKAIVVSTSAGGERLFLLWNDKKYATDRESLTSLGMSSGTALEPIQVSASMLNTIPTGAALRARELPDNGQAVTVGGITVPVGDVVQASTSTGGGQYYVAAPDGGLAPIHGTEYNLLVGAGKSEHEVTVADINAAQRSEQKVQTDVPPTVPPLAELPSGPTTPMCVWADNAAAEQDTARITYGGDIPAGSTTRQVGATPSPMTADRVWMPGGSIALVQVVPGPGLPASEYVLVNTAGVRFPIPASKDTLEKLGYGSVELGKVSRRFVDLLPSGPALDSANAKKQVGAG